MCGAEGAQGGRQAMQADVMAGANRERAGELAGGGFGVVAHEATHVVEFVQPLPGTGQQGATGLGQRDATADAIKQRSIQLFFQHLDALGHRRLSQVQRFRRFLERFVAGDFNKGSENGGIHGSESRINLGENSCEFMDSGSG